MNSISRFAGARKANGAQTPHPAPAKATTRSVSAGGYPTAPVALTFDDGPDPQWTPLVLDALAGATASATFFVLHRCRFDRGPGLDLRPTPRGLGGFTCDRRPHRTRGRRVDARWRRGRTRGTRTPAPRVASRRAWPRRKT